MSELKKHLFTSERLGFRNWVESDSTPFYEMNSNRQVMEFFPGVLSKNESDNLIIRLQKHYEEHGFTFYAVDELATNDFIGFIGIIKTSINEFFTPCVEIGWRLTESSWGRGLATEGARRCLEYGFETLKFKEIYSFTPITNSKSEKIMTKIGLVKAGSFNHPKIEKGHELELHNLYKITK